MLFAGKNREKGRLEESGTEQDTEREMGKRTDHAMKREGKGGIACSVILLLCSLFFLTASVYGWLRAMEETRFLQTNGEAFDPFSGDAGEEPEIPLKFLTAQGLTYEFAEDFKGTDRYYFAFTETGEIRVVIINGDLPAQCQELVDFLFREGPGSTPEPVVLSGTATPMGEDIRQYGREALSYLLGQTSMTEEEFSAIVGEMCLDTTRMPVAGQVFRLSLALLLTAAILFAAGIGLFARQMSRISQSRELSLGEAQTKPVKEPADLETEQKIFGEEPAEWNEAQAKAEEVQAERSEEPEEPGAGRAEPEEQRTEQEIRAEAGARNRAEKRMGAGRFLCGILGAFLGALAGAVLWLLVSLFGIIAGLAGFVMLRLTLLGYEKFSGKLDKKGAVICLLLTVMMIPAADLLDYGIALCRVYLSYDFSLDTIFFVTANFGTLMTEFGAWSGFVRDLIVGLVLSVLASWNLILTVLRQKKTAANQ